MHQSTTSAVVFINEVGTKLEEEESMEEIACVGRKKETLGSQ